MRPYPMPPNVISFRRQVNTIDSELSVNDRPHGKGWRKIYPMQVVFLCQLPVTAIYKRGPTLAINRGRRENALYINFGSWGFGAECGNDLTHIGDGNIARKHAKVVNSEQNEYLCRVKRSDIRDAG